MGQGGAAAAEVAAQYREQASVSSEQPGRLTAEMLVMAMAAGRGGGGAHRFQCVSPAHVRVRRTHKAEPGQWWLTTSSVQVTPSFFYDIRKMMPRKILDVLLMLIRR